MSSGTKRSQARKALGTAAAAALVLVGLAAGPAGAADEAPAAANAAALATKTVLAKDSVFSPSRVTIAKGDSVTWKSAGRKVHTVTSATGAWPSKGLSPGQTFTKRFDAAGTYRYRCQIHSGMNGTVVVA